ncbi:MAG: RNA polymerase subunit sigma-70, partial [Gloeobacteraceae cyanobacterium ES-bin-316]|nr:RNA polymerase subunit sigma-70 [Ferruginibacter sp.]
MQKTIGISEPDLIEKCKSGDLKYQELLYKHFYGYAMGIGMRYLANKDDVMEVVNDSFIKVFNGINFFNQTHPFKAWLRRIVINTSIDYLRKNLKYKSDADIEQAAYIGKAAEFLEHLSENDILNLMDALPEIHRMVFNL